jgi:hypothetical protein
VNNIEGEKTLKKNGENLVEWFLGFLKVDLGKQSAADIRKLVTELEGALRGQFYAEDFYGDLNTRTRMLFAEDNETMRSLLAKGGEKVRSLQKALREFVQGIGHGYEDAKQIADASFTEEEFTTMGCLGKVQFTIEVQARLKAHYLIGEDPESPELLYGWKKEALNEAICKIETASKNSEEAIKYQFLVAFNGLPLKALRRCPKCKNWFLHLSKRERQFCSNRCAAKNISDKKYDALRQDRLLHKQELEKKKERSHESYVRKQKAKNPGVKVQRRPRKPKPKED